VANPNIKLGMNNPNLMAELVRQYSAVYLERQKVMRQIREIRGEAWFKVVATEQDRICLEFHAGTTWRVQRGCFSQRLVADGRQPPPWYFTSMKAKKAAIALHRKNTEWLEKHSGATSPQFNAFLATEALRQLENTQVHPWAKELLAFSRLLSRERSLSAQKQQLGSTIRQLSKMELGVKVEFGSINRGCASDRITSVTVGERTMKTKDFLDLLEFEAAVFGA